MSPIAPLTHTYYNPAAKSYTCPPPSNAPEILRFHQTLPTYARTPLVRLPDSLSHELGLGKVYVKDESQRFSLPSFKILGASWAVHRTLCAALKLPHTTSIAALAVAAQSAGLKLVLCTDGNWGRAVAHTARLLGVHATVHVPRNIDEATRDKIAGEGAEVRVVEGDYDASIQAAIDASKETGALLVMDTSWPGYEEIPGWVTEGYESMLGEVDDALAADIGSGEEQQRGPDLVIVSVGVGSWAHSVVAHYKSLDTSLPLGLSAKQRKTVIVTVEPTTASCLLTSLHSKRITSIRTSDTIMCGMNCGTTSTIAWPLLHEGVDIALTVSDWDAHEAVLELGQYGVEAGPCGAAPLAALKKLVREGILKERSQETGEALSVVLFCTEGMRDYDTPEKEK